MDAIASLRLAVSAIIRMLSGKAASIIGAEMSRSVLSEEMTTLHTDILPTIQTVIDAAEAVPAEQLMPWLAELRDAAFETEDAAFEAEDAMDMLGYETTEARIAAFPRVIAAQHVLYKRIGKLQDSADQAKEWLKLIHMARTTAPPQDIKSEQSAATTGSGLSSPVFGRDEERDDLIDMLISEQHHESSSTRNITLHALYGLEGAGKTTLAQYVCNEERVKGHFDTRMLVRVSRNFDVHIVTRKIIESAGQGKVKCYDNLNLGALRMVLKELLNSKKFLLVLDDVWCKDKGEWDKLLVPLNKSGNVGSRILITTRMEGVALELGVKNKNIRSLKDLRPEDCLSILKYYAFGDANKAIEDQDLAATAKKIVDS